MNRIRHWSRAREKRDQDRIESERLSRRRRTAIIATSRTAMNEEQIANATQAAASKTSIEKPKRVESETFEPTGNMFADVINEMMKDGAA
ncbi:hypothetical protein HSBAA_29200 [Vreelandella sulfidaeris]|uniref:Uncharacterized protein n=1 Tax=Vreelandella sulfidaeris TaxID=115553 RepID=A0A455UEQ5_9GAMM|nr:hypothetical protein HSBAA_29200 [Halomonas sulfidaeris]